MAQPDTDVGKSLPEYGKASLHESKDGAAAEPAKFGPASRLIGILLSPGETFADINRKPTWLFPLLFVMLVTVASSQVFNWRVKPDWAKIIRNQIIQRAEDNNQPRPTEDQLEQGVEFGLKITRFFRFGFVLFPPIISLIFAGVFALAMIFVQANTTFKKIFSVVAWSGCAYWTLSSVVTCAVLMTKDTESLADIDMRDPSSLAATNLAALIPSDSGAVLRALASSIDVFSIWWIILLIIGLAAIGGSKKITKSTTGKLVVALWILFVALKVGVAATGFFGR